MTTEQILAAIERRKEIEKRATPGPWTVNEAHGRDTNWIDVVAGPNDNEVACGEPQMLPHIVHKDFVGKNEEAVQQVRDDLGLIAVSRNDYALLLDVAKAYFSQGQVVHSNRTYRVVSKIREELEARAEREWGGEK